MKKTRVAIVGYGNIGHYVLDALLTSPDMEVAGVVRRNGNVDSPAELADFPVVKSISELKDVDVAILSTPTRSVEQYAKECLALGINTVDSFDIHTKIVELRRSLDAVAKANNAVSVISAGWDPGSDSVVRALMQSLAPKGLTWTNFGPGMSMGHSVVARSKKGVKNALSMTMPQGAGIHSRLVYVELEDGFTAQQVYDELKADDYFAHDELHVIPVASVDDCRDMGHGVLLERKGVSGKTQNQLFEFKMKINNPALTGQMMVNAARATLKQQPGCYTLIEIPVIDFLYGDREELVGHLV